MSEMGLWPDLYVYVELRNLLTGRVTPRHATVMHWAVTSGVGAAGDEGDRFPQFKIRGNNPPHFSGKTACKTYVTWSLIISTMNYKHS